MKYVLGDLGPWFGSCYSTVTVTQTGLMGISRAGQ